MTVTDRTDLIRDTLITLITEGLPSLHVSPCTGASWAAYPPAPYHFYGWRPAMIVSKEGEAILTVPICPDVIHDQTEGMSDSSLRKYLQVIAYLSGNIASRVAALEPSDITDEVVQKICWDVEKELDEGNADALRWMHAVWAKALD